MLADNAIYRPSDVTIDEDFDVNRLNSCVESRLLNTDVLQFKPCKQTISIAMEFSPSPTNPIVIQGSEYDCFRLFHLISTCSISDIAHSPNVITKKKKR